MSESNLSFVSRVFAWLALPLALTFYFSFHFALFAEDSSLTFSYISLNVLFLSFIIGRYSSLKDFAFTSSFWLVVTFLFYIILRSVYSIGELSASNLRAVLLMGVAFLVGYIIGGTSITFLARRNGSSSNSTPKFMHSRVLYLWLLFCFLLFKLLNIALGNIFSVSGNALEISAATQNGGASYLFKIPVLANATYFLIILLAYRFKIYKATAFFLTIWLMCEAILGAGRYTIVVTTLIHIYLYHTYVKSISVIFLAAISPFLISIVSFLGYVRNVEVGSWLAYKKTFEIFLEQRYLILELFIARLDMLPNMVEAYRLLQSGVIELKYGGSYLFAFLHAVPRTVWPDKPPLTAAYITEYVNEGVFRDGVNIFPSVMIEGYMNFAWFGPFFVGWILAILSYWYDAKLRTGSLGAQAFCLMAFTFPMAFVNEGIHSNIMGTLLYLFGLYVIWLLFTKLVIGKACFRWLLKG